jgi:hypothetical protein
MIRRRSGGASLIGRAAQTAARTALIAGTATAVAGRVAGRQQGPEGSALAPDGPAGLSDEAMEQLRKLAELHTSGILTEEEFATQKARILG